MKPIQWTRRIFHLVTRNCGAPLGPWCLRADFGARAWRSLRLGAALISLTICFPALAVSQQSEPSLDAQAIIQRSVQANNLDWKQAPEYNYLETDREEGGGTKTHEVTMILGSPYERLVAVNGEPLSADQQQEEQSKMEQVIATRRKESPRQRAQRVARYERDRKRDHLLMQQLTEAFDFTLQGTQKLGPYEVYWLKATPRAGYRPPNLQSKVLTGMEGQLWVDTKTYQWVKVEATVIHPVSIEGFVARVEPGTRFELENTRVADDLWLPKHFAMKASAKILMLFNHREQQDQTFSDYRKAEADSPVSSAGR